MNIEEDETYNNKSMEQTFINSDTEEDANQEYASSNLLNSYESYHEQDITLSTNSSYNNFNTQI